ncbi:armadillo-type protein [Myxozyma melibiosi]|uniref:Armadillo-type protein n=1 Tax=Myxozyma melibiosi TaxID=54550 RepID=A0ABR1F9W4_9ASCO
MDSSANTASDPALSPLLQALSALYAGNSDAQTKGQAGQYLEQFQKSPEAWTLTHTILSSPTQPMEAKVFAAQTLRSKIIYDMHQLAEENKLELRNSIVTLLVSYKAGPKLIVTQLCLALANLAIQLTEWKNAIEEVITACGNDATSAPIVLEFLKVLPEEASDIRKIPLSGDELRERTMELLQNNANQVMNILIAYVEAAETPKSSYALIFECLNSWLREVPLVRIVNSPLLGLVFQALENDDLFDAATDCVCSMIRETRDVDESMDVIPTLYTKIMELRPKIAGSAEDPEAFRNYTRIFADAGEAWHMLAARNPAQFRPMVEAVAECAAYDEDLEVVQFTFYFWYLLKQMLVLDRYETARRELKDIYLSLVDVIISHLKYPYEEHGGDLFGNDKEQEEKFRSFRHEMGDVLKDCCAVVGPSFALRKAYVKVNDCIQAQKSGQNVPWQDIEAPIFSMRAMAREVDLDETHVMPEIMDLLVQLPKHPKVQFAVILVLGRYTEWTAKHPKYLDMQLPYITGAFQDGDADIAGAAAQSMMHFCRDCGQHLAPYIDQLHSFYEQVAPRIHLDSLYDLTDGVAHLVAAQPIDKIYEHLKSFCMPIVQRLYARTSQTIDEDNCRKAADELELLDTFARLVHPSVERGTANPCMQFWIEIWPLINTLLDTMGSSTFVSERICKFMRTLMQSYRNDFYPLLPAVAERLVDSFEKHHYGCYLWASGICVREYGNEYSDQSTQEAVWNFALRQSISMFKYMSTINIADIPDAVEDLFRLLANLMTNYPYRFLQSELCKPSIDAALAIFAIENKEPIFTAIDLLHDIFSYGFKTPPRSHILFNEPGDQFYEANEVPPEIQALVKQMIYTEGAVFTQRIFSGLLYTFPRDCVSDGVSVLLVVLRLAGLPSSVQWVDATLNMLPAGSITPQERAKYLQDIENAIQSDDMNKLRSQSMDLIGWYTRRNITPRSAVRRIGDIRDMKFSYQ